MHLNGYRNYNKGLMPGNTSGVDLIDIELKNCVPVVTVPITPKVENKSTNKNHSMTEKQDIDARNFPILKI